MTSGDYGPRGSAGENGVQGVTGIIILICVVISEVHYVTQVPKGKWACLDQKEVLAYKGSKVRRVPLDHQAHWLQQLVVSPMCGGGVAAVPLVPAPSTRARLERPEVAAAAATEEPPTTSACLTTQNTPSPTSQALRATIMSMLQPTRTPSGRRVEGTL